MSRKRLTLLLLAMTLIVVGTMAFVLAMNLTPRPDGTVTLEVNVPSGFVQPSAPACAEVFVPGKVVDIKGADFACKDPDGTTHFMGGFRCKDGGHLWSITADTGAPEGWFLAGQPFQKAVTDDVAADPSYGKAYEACL